MNTSNDEHRYLARFDTRAMGHLYTDCLVIGAGAGGLRTALEAAKSGRVLVLVKNKVPDSNTYNAQGGIATVIRKDDTFESHIDDTLQTGCGLCDRDTVEMVVRNGPSQLQQLLEWKTPFDMEEGQLAAGREGGHSNYRIAHALGDATGKAIAQSLWDQVRANPSIKIFEDCFCIDLLTNDSGCLGAITHHPAHGMQCIWAHRTVLATGGAGRLWRETTNPPSATSDGLAMAYRAGAVLADLEFMQFHPTTLYIAGAERTLVTEARRGQGARLGNSKGQRFMPDYHDMAELAPRDVVSRAIANQMEKNGATHVFLDVRHRGRKWLQKHFPTISALCDSFDINVDENLIPVRPSAHYMVGGVKTDLNGRTNIPHLFCCGEAAATGLHGGNRLASNSLLEAVVFGKKCGEIIAHEIATIDNGASYMKITHEIEESKRTQLDITDVENSLRSVMWRNVGLERHADRLSETIEIIDFWKRYVMDKVFDKPADWQCQNMLTISRLITQSALRRQESRGVHYRNDYPDQDDGNFKHHFAIKK
ncbi:MAG: L-aspartate oxidase [Phycisphaerae bacterium]|nr:L-aspartate oxidase [Phycisphaerae bacterium]